MLIECFKGTAAGNMPGCKNDIPEKYDEKFAIQEAEIMVYLTFRDF